MAVALESVPTISTHYSVGAQPADFGLRPSVKPIAMFVHAATKPPMFANPWAISGTAST